MIHGVTQARYIRALEDGRKLRTIFYLTTISQPEVGTKWRKQKKKEREKEREKPLDIESNKQERREMALVISRSSHHPVDLSRTMCFYITVGDGCYFSLLLHSARM